MKEFINGAVVHYCMGGDGPQKILLLHGWGCDLKMMQPVADSFGEQYSTLLVDFPGHGQSSRPPEPWGVPDYADCIKRLLEKLSFRPCAVIAHSFGCRVAAWLEAKDPKMFSKIVFTGAAGIRPIQTEDTKKRSETYRKLKGYSEILSKVPLLRSTAEKWQEKLRQKYGSRDYNALDEEMRKTFVKVINQDLIDLYSRFQASTLLIWGDEDHETPLWMAKEMEKRIPDAGLVILEGGTHFAYLEQIRRFNLIVQQFLKEDE